MAPVVQNYRGVHPSRIPPFCKLFVKLASEVMNYIACKAGNPDQNDFCMAYHWQIFEHPPKGNDIETSILPKANQANIIYKHMFKIITSLL